MEYEATNTKLALLNAAGELFAEHGYEGVSTRMIADKAGVNLGGIHYHFGGKENLYLEVFRYMARHAERFDLMELFEEHLEQVENPEDLARFIHRVVVAMFEEHVVPQGMDWRATLFARECIAPSRGMEVAIEEIFRPEREAVITLFRRVKPETPDDEAHAWADILSSHLVFYTLARQPLELLRGPDALSPQFLEIASAMTARAMIHELGLPVPDELKAPTPAATKS